jgi:hypothetical protein
LDTLIYIFSQDPPIQIYKIKSGTHLFIFFRVPLIKIDKSGNGTHLDILFLTTHLQKFTKLKMEPTYISFSLWPTYKSKGPLFLWLTWFFGCISPSNARPELKLDNWSAEGRGHLMCVWRSNRSISKGPLLLWLSLFFCRISHSNARPELKLDNWSAEGRGRHQF